MTPGAALRARRSAAPLPATFFDRDTEIVSRELLGAVLECETADGVASGRIVETEAYLGPHDAACHAIYGRTQRTDHLFGPAGTSYVYFIYGVHWCFNAVTGADGQGSAVLVRAIEPVAGIELMHSRRHAARTVYDLTNGPGKLCQALGIEGRHSGLSLQQSPLRIRHGEPVPDDEVIVTPRIGITRAAALPLRWLVRGNKYVSRTPRHFEQRPLRATGTRCELRGADGSE